MIKIGVHYKPIQTSKINCFYIKEKCNFIRTDTGKNYPVDFSLDKIEQLIDLRMFFRVSRNFIVNLNAIDDIITYSSNRLKIILKNWTEKVDIIISRERVADFKKWME